MHLDLAVDFSTKQLRGNATHTMQVVKTTRQAQFDIWNLNISACYNATSG